MPTVVAMCPHCGQLIDAPALVLTDTAERVWKAVRQLAAQDRDGIVLSSDVAALAFCTQNTALYHLHRLKDLYRLVETQKKTPGGRYNVWRIATRQPAPVLCLDRVTPVHLRKVS